MNRYQDFCTYCGDYFQCRDHVVPASQSHVYRTYQAPCVSACQQCNDLAGDYPAHSIADKATFLLTKYEGKLLLGKQVHWTKCELDELDHGLKSFVESSIRKDAVIRAKLKNLERVSLCLYPIPLFWNENEIEACGDELQDLWDRLLEKTAMGEILLQEVSNEKLPRLKRRRKTHARNNELREKIVEQARASEALRRELRKEALRRPLPKSVIEAMTRVPKPTPEPKWKWQKKNMKVWMKTKSPEEGFYKRFP